MLYICHQLIIRKVRIILLSIVLLLFTSCERILNFEIIGDGKYSEPVLQKLSSFSRIDFYDDFELEIRQAEQQQVYVQAESNLLRFVTTEVSDEQLLIQRLPNYTLVPRHPIKIVIETPDLKEISIYGKGKLLIDTLGIQSLSLNIYSRSNVKIQAVRIQDFKLLSNSGGEIDIEGEFSSLNFRQAGSGSSQIRGLAEDALLVQEGSGIIKARDLYPVYLTVSLFGSGLVYCRALNYFSVLIEDNGRILYTGSEPDSKDIKGEGRLIRN